MTANLYSRPQSLAKIDRILAYMEGRDYVTVQQVAQACDMGEVSAGDYLRHIGRLGKAHCLKRVKHHRGGSTPGKWKIGPKPDGIEGRLDLVRRVVVLKSWTPGAPAMFEPMACLYGRAA